MDEQQQRELIGRRLRQAREALNLSQGELANRISRTQYAISEYENANRRIYAHDLPKLAQTLNVTINYFFMPYEDDETEESNPNLEEYLLVQFRNLPTNEAKEFVTNLVQQLNTVIDTSSSDKD